MLKDSRMLTRWTILAAIMMALLLTIGLVNRPVNASAGNGATAPLGGPTATATLCANPFVDINGNVFYVSIVKLYCLGVLEGTDATHYSPATITTRAVAAKAIVLGFGIAVYTPTSPSFTDVPASSPYFVYIETAYHANIIAGIDANGCAAHNAIFPCFLPALDTTLEELAVFIQNAGGYIPGTPGNGATPGRRDEFAGMLDNGIFGGPTSTPTDTVTGTPPTATPTFTPAPPTDTPSTTPTVTDTATPLPPTPTLCPNPFLDINGNIFYLAILDLYCRGAVSGTDATHFNPAGTSTRAQFTKVIVLALNYDLNTPVVQDFNDVPPSYFAYKYIGIAYAKGIVSGLDSNTCTLIGSTFPCFGPNLPITRAQLTKIVVSAANIPIYTPTIPTFSDVGPNNAFYVLIETAHHYGIINGYPDGSFRPNLSIRRDEMAQIIYKAITLFPPPTATPTPMH